MGRYRVNLEVGRDGSCMAHVVELPGCIAMGATREETVAAAREAIARHLAWLRQHGEPAPADDGIDVEVAETVSAAGSFPGTPGDQVGFFASDREPPTDEEIERALRWAEYSRRDLLALFQDVPRQAPSTGSGQALDWSPDLPAGRQAAGPWTMRRILEHIASAEAFYVTRLDAEADRGPSSLLSVLRDAASRRLRSLSSEERATVRTPRGEPWSARKVLRRFLEHEHEHLGQLRELVERYRGS
ncbi:MAG: type II toxin-antitoxin system HicB family antitoxin [Chloroflexota bacterium]|nr:type II toxin-antitoxin system HicB family antitoxin [Chloroflexota bacterium]